MDGLLLINYNNITIYTSLFCLAVESIPQAAKMSSPREARMVVKRPCWVS